MKSILLGCIKLYQATRFLRRPCCRFYPSCSSYLAQALILHGLAKGLYLGVVRLLRCHPFYPGGLDEVPVPSRREVRR